MADFPRLAALAVVLRDGHLLLVRRKNEPDAGLWGYPGGQVDLGETAGEAAVRELREETSVIAAPRAYIDSLDIIRRAEDGAVSFHFLLVAVLCDYVEGVPVAADDVTEAKWVPFETVLNRALPLSKDVDTVLKHALSQTGQAPFAAPPGG